MFWDLGKRWHRNCAGPQESWTEKVPLTPSTFARVCRVCDILVIITEHATFLSFLLHCKSIVFGWTYELKSSVYLIVMRLFTHHQSHKHRQPETIHLYFKSIFCLPNRGQRPLSLEERVIARSASRPPAGPSFPARVARRMKLVTLNAPQKNTFRNIWE